MGETLRDHVRVTVPAYVRSSKNGVVIDVFVQPRAAKEGIVGVHGSALKLKVRAAPADGKANRAAEGLLASALSVPPSAVTVISGHASRSKRVEVTSATVDSVACELARVLGSSAHDSG